MKKKLGIIKRRIAAFLIVALSINSFGAIVSDNDGSAFITKSEFDALKSSFQSQIDSYNNSIDSKIDGAIAAYLSGITINQEYRLSLPESKGYVFPIIYDTGDKWNDHKNTWHIPIRPELHRKDIASTFYYGRSSGLNDPNWDAAVATNSYLALQINGKTPVNNWVMAYMYEYELNIKARITEGFEVTKSGDKRTISGHGDCVVYDIKNFGKGNAIINYAPKSQFIPSYSNWGAYYVNKSDYKSNVIWYPYAIGYAWNFKTKTAFSGVQDILWTPKHLTYYLGGNRGFKVAPAEYDAGSDKTLSSILNALNITNISSGNPEPRTLFDETDEIDSNSVNWKKSGYTSRLYGRGASCPIIGTNFRLQLKEHSVATDAYWSQVYKFKGQVGAAAVSYATMSVAYLVSANMAFLPNNIADDNTSFDASDSDYYSKLPSSLVRYTTTTGDTHYLDEGMWIGEMSDKGAVQFTVLFDKDSGTGTQVELHVSKKPFSYDYNDSQLLEVSCNGTNSNKPKINYGVANTITINGIEVDDNLYIEWIPVDTDDLPKLTNFSDYMIIVEK